MVTCDGAGASHDLIARLDKLAARPGYQVIYSVGWELGARERAAITAVPAGAWQIAVDARGQIRERRADQACGDLDCGHRRCWIEEAHVVERAQRRVAAGLERCGFLPHGAPARPRAGTVADLTSSNPAALSPAWRSTRRSRPGTTAPGAPVDGSVIAGYPATVTAGRVRVRSR
jgi:hypothetical protein